MNESSNTAVSRLRQIEPICAEFEENWRAGRRPVIREHLERVSEVFRDRLLVELYRLDIEYRRLAGESPQEQDYFVEFPQLARLLAEAPSAASDVLGASLHVTVTFDSPGGRASPNSGDRSARPAAYGRYIVAGRLGSGAYGVVYRGWDPELKRDVAIKVARPEKLAPPADTDHFLGEARTMAGIDHPNIVPIFDCGRTESGECFIVSKLVEGTDLRTAMRERRYSPVEGARLIAAAAEALHAAHKHGIVHRDVKPANILLDQQGQPLVGDFGLALRPDAFGTGPERCGTVAYMSPEQAQARADKVDARSDVYALGVILFELTTGQRPYRSVSGESLIREIADEHTPVRPPRQILDTMPEAFERIIMQALAKRQTDRYTTALDLATDLRAWVACADGRSAFWSRGRVATAGLATVAILAAAITIMGRSLSPATPLRIESVEIPQLVLDENGDRLRIGSVLKAPYALREGDGVQFRAKLSHPAYCYWLAFRPDGIEELCFPENADEPPPRTAEPVYPWRDRDRDDTCYAFTDGPGLQAFLLVVSGQPLPSYSNWKRQRGDAPWRAAHAASMRGILRHDGLWVESYSLAATNVPRGKGQKIQDDAGGLSQLVRWAQTDPTITAIEAWELPVPPRAVREKR